MVSPVGAGFIILSFCLAAIILICLIIYCIARSTDQPLRPVYPEYLQGDPENYYMYNRNQFRLPLQGQQYQQPYQPTSHIANGQIVPIVNEFYAPPAETYVPNNGNGLNGQQAQSGMVEYYAPVGHMHATREQQTPMTPSQMHVAELQRAIQARPMGGEDAASGGNDVDRARRVTFAPAPTSSTEPSQQGPEGAEGNSAVTSGVTRPEGASTEDLATEAKKKN